MTANTDQPLAAPARRLAALDAGSNSIRLEIAEVQPDGTYRVLDDEKETTRLGHGLSGGGAMDRSNMDQSIQAILRMKAIADGYGVERLRAVATSAVREASNRREFLDRVREEARVELEIIPVETEARLAYLSVSHAFDLGAMQSAVVDIGGGSTEIVFASRGVVEHIYSLSLGAVRLAEQFGLSSDDVDGNAKARKRRYEEMRRHISRAIKQAVSKPSRQPQVIYGTGGTFTTLASMAMHRLHQTAGNSDESALSGVRGYELDRATLKHLLHALLGMPSKARGKLPGLNSDRADIIIEGLAIVDAVIKRFGANAVRVHDRGIRDGLLLQMIREELPEVMDRHSSTNAIMDSVRRFAGSCNYEQEHSEHVTMLALQIFDQLAALQSPPWMTPAARLLLESAAVLHDIGYSINYAKHHKHSYHLIMHSDLQGWTNRDLAVVANVARYHRRAAPKRSHANFNVLEKADRKLVRGLSAILRVADGLDRTHGQQVKQVHVIIKGDAVVFQIQSRIEPTVDMWGGQRKSMLFKKAFRLQPKFQWLSEAQAAAERAAPLLVEPAANGEVKSSVALTVC